ncbi:hypothetical protein WG904_04570 [Pedobacter sp. Du54]|uniref:hypothetical protein n=1 Tax=Pedobacter anseongensis TaxID=3133439 RepID=UPI0030A886B7
MALVILIFSKNLSAQTTLRIDGEVLVEGKQPIVDANLILKSKTGVIISFRRSDKNGSFVFEINVNVKDFVIEASHLGFQKESQLVSFSEGIEAISLVIVLKATITSLPEINIAHKPTPISIKNDTTTYKVSSFLRGDEEVVEDVLKKLPGIEVSESGKITYKGKSISKVLIEGDDLFSKNYQNGTKNIKSAVLDKVQAIENYVENGKLVGLKRTNETVLNLKIKEDAKNKPNLSVSLAYGPTKTYQVDNNLIGVGKSFKYFVFNTVNNGGANPTPYDYFNFNNTSEESLELSLPQTKIIGIDYALPILEAKRGNINQTYFSNGNAFIRLNKGLNLTANYSLYADKITVIKSSLTEFGKLAEGVSFNEHKVITKKPIIGSALFIVQKDISKKSNVGYISSFSTGRINSSEELIANYGAFVSSLTDKNTSIQQKLAYTNRLSPNSALKIATSYFFIRQPQIYLLSPTLNVADDTLNKQSIDLYSNLLSFDSEYFFKNRLFQHSFVAQFDKKGEDFTSYSFESKLYKNSLNKEDYHANLGYSNTLPLKNIQLSSSLIYKFKKSATLGEEISPLNYTINLLSPSINVQYKLRKYDKFSLSGSYDSFLPELTDMYQNYILVDNKSISKGIYQKSVIGKYSLVSSFIHADLFNQFIYFLNFIYFKNSKSYGNSLKINPQYIINNRAIFPGVGNYILAGGVSKYLPFLNSTLKYNHSLSGYEFFGQVNSLAIKSYSIFNSSQLVDIKSGFDGWFDFEAGLKYNTIKFRLTHTKNQHAQLYSNLILKPANKLFFSLSSEMYFNNLNSINEQCYYFLDVNARYKFNKKATLKVVGENITDNRTFKTKIINQFSISTDRYSVLPATLLFEFSYRF